MDSPPPVLARVLRGGRTESVHRGDVAVVQEDGELVAFIGDPNRRIYLRSAAKPFQAMPLLERGGERAFRLGDDEIALMCASHGGEPRHVRVARRLLRRGRLGVEDLSCGAHLPMHEPSARRLIARGEAPSALHNNCSGKHAGLLLACRLEGVDTDGYWRPSHPIQVAVLDRVAQFCGLPASEIPVAVDGCRLPVFFLPLAGLARGYARLVARRNGPTRRSRDVSRRICRAMWESPGMVAGLDRFTTDFLRVGHRRWIGKEGAEGVYAIGLAPSRKGERALGIAFKIEDGSSRARDAIALEILNGLGRSAPDARRYLERYREPLVFNVPGDPVGRISAGPARDGIIASRVEP